ncbi:MAG: discoidin domain-containing protein [Phycisphaerae bacterium]|nr:discoidin domain-containing protein [Saprospiraceae bacterium]
MSLAEVIVNGKLVNPKLANSDDNVALGKPARQSSSWDFSSANRANDGDINGRQEGGSISHTNGDNQPYWEVDLGKKYLIEKVKVYNRTDGYQERLNNFNILVTDKVKEDMTTNYEPFAENEKKFDGPSKTFNNKKIGRFVRVELNDQNFLHMGELQVFGSEAGDINIGASSANVIYKVSVFRNLSDTENDVESKVAKSIEEGMDFSRTAGTSHKDYWSLSATAKVSAKYGVVDFEASVTAGGGGETTNSSSSTNSNSMKESTVEETTSWQKVAGKSVRYEFHKFVINQSPIHYKLNGEDYSWFRIDEGAQAAGDITVLVIPAALNEQFKMTNDN